MPLNAGYRVQSVFYKITVFLDNGEEFSFFGGTGFFARQKMGEIAVNGLCITKDNGDMVWFPSHRILRIVAEKKEV